MPYKQEVVDLIIIYFMVYLFSVHYSLILQFDPAIQRYNALKATKFEYFKVTPKSGIMGFLLTILPVGLLYYTVQSRHVSYKLFFKLPGGSLHTCTVVWDF